MTTNHATMIHHTTHVLQFPVPGGPLVDLGVELGTGGVLGVLVGFAAKKLAKVAAVIAGAIVGLLATLEMEGLVTVHWGALRELLATTPVGERIPALLLELSAGIPIGGGFVAGVALGFKKG